MINPLPVHGRETEHNNECTNANDSMCFNDDGDVNDIDRPD
jgi:hypothetical protein